jgi:hypothetical protein
MRLPVALAVVAAAASLAAAPAGAAAAATDSGVVQSVSPARIVLRELDGSTVTIAMAPRTRVLVNGVAAALADIRPGFVATVAHNGARPARLVRAFGRLQRLVTRGILVSVSRRTVAVRTTAGETLTVRVTARTRIRVRGLAARLADLRRGAAIEVTHTPGGEALRLAARKT